MERLSVTSHRCCNALVVVVLLLSLLPIAQNTISPRFDPPIAHAQEGASTPLEEVTEAPDEPDASSDGPSGQLLATRMAEPEVVSPGDLITYTVALTNTTAAVDEPDPSLNGASGGLLATKTADQEVVSPGDLLTYAIVLTNTTRAAMEGLVVSDPLPDGLAYLPGSAGDGDYDPKTRTLTWDIKELAAGASLSLGFQARVRGDALDELVVNLAEVTGGGLAEPVQAQATVAVVRRALINPQGGVLVSPSGRVRVEFPGGAVPQPIWAIYRLREVHQLPPSQPGLALRFDLTAEVATDENTAPPFTQFQKPVRLTVDLTELVDEAALGEYQRPFVGYLDEATGRWVHLPVVAQQVGPVLTVEVDHFSTFGGGVEGSTDNEGWRLLYNEPQVALFSGAAVYNYPIEVPPGRNGLQPALNLSYNSRRVDGVTNWIESDWAGMGWSVDLMDIVREGLECHMHDQTVFIHYENRFSLLMNGTSYELEPEPGVGAGQPGRYHVKDAPYLYVKLKDDAPYPEAGGNVTGLYWIVKTPDGTSYQLGYTTNSEQVLWPTPNGEGWYNRGVKDSGREKNYTTYRWRLDEAVDVYSNTMQMTYREAQGGHLEKRDTASVLHEVKYNSMGGGQWATKVIFNPDGPNFGPQPGYIDMRIFGSQGQLNRIEVWHGGQRVRYYDLGYENTTTPASTTIRSLISIQQFSGDGSQTLPATTFDYEFMDNKGKCCPTNPGDTSWNNESFPYPRLVRVDNGYGGVAEFDYVDDERGGYWAFYNYRVSNRRIYDGIDTAPARVITYTYGTKCYDQTTDNPDDYPVGAVTCTGRSAPYLGPLVGHDWMTETLYSDDVPLVETTHRFYIDTNHSWRLGREHQTQIYSGQGERLRQTDTTWGSTAISNTTFAHVDEVLATDYGSSETVSTRVDYDYDNHGNLTMQGEYANAGDANPYRTYRWWYYPNETAHIVDRMASAGVYVGEGWDLASATWYFYDGNASPTQSPGSRGELTRVARLQVIDPGEMPGEEWPDCVHAYRTSEVEYDYDDYGNLITETTYADYGYMCQDSNWNVLPRGADKEPTQPRTTQTVYDGTIHAFPIQQTNAASHVTEWYYYGVNGTSPVPAGGFFGKLEREKDPNNAETWYRYDAFGRLTKVIRPYDSDTYPTVEYAYEDGPTMRVQTLYREASGCGGCVRPVLTFYDGLGRVVQTKAESQNGTQMIITNVTYNAQGLRDKEYVPYFRDGSSDFWDYVTPDTNQPKTTYAYDALGRVLIQTNPDNTQIEHHYGVADGMAYDDVIDPNRHRVQYRYDAFGRLGRVYEMSGDCGNYWGYDCGGQYNTPWAVYATTDYTYDVLDNLTTVTDTLGYTTTMSYDMLGRKTQMTDPDMGTWSYDYDAAGNLTSQTDGRGCSISFTYDALNRLTGKTYNGPGACGSTPGVSYTYDQGTYGKGRRTRMDDGSGYTTWSYDARGRVTGETKNIAGAGSFTTQYTYRADDQVHTMTYPGGEVITTTYNARGLPKTLTSSLGDTYVTDASYTPEGRLDLLSLGSDLRINHDYYPWNTPNGQGRLQGIQSGTVGQPTLLQNLSYVYDAAGNVQSLMDNEQTTTFTYDPLDRLTGASGAYSEGYNYNEIGNLTYKSGVGSYSYDSGKPHAVTSAGGNSYSYDLNGNMISRTVDGTSYTLTYDAENRLNSVTQGGQTTTFTYDADGQRVMRDTMTDTIVYVGSHYEARFEEQDMPEDFDGDCVITVVDIMQVASRWSCQCGNDCYAPLYDFDADCEITVADIMQVAARWREMCPEELTETVKYYTLGGRRVAMRKVPADPPGQVGTLYYLFSDHLGSTSVSYRATDGITITQRYYSWGTIRPGPDNALPTDYTFTGQKLDESTGLMYYGARYYDPALGRFVQADTIVPEPGNPQALNRYSYVLNNPLRYTDPTGHQPVKWLKSVIRWAQPHVYHWTGPGSPFYSHHFSVGWASVSIRDINNLLGDIAIWGIRSSEIERAAQDAGVPTILLAAALHHQGGSPDLRDLIVMTLGFESEEDLSRGIGQITIREAKEYNKERLVLDPVPDETLDEALYIREVSVRYMAAKLKESSLLIDEYLRDPNYSTISLSDENRWLLLMPAQNLRTGAVDRFFKICGGNWSCWFADWSIYSQVLNMRDDIAWLEEHGWTE